MRKACFAFVMILAAFTGGAFMNGPGLSWLKSAIRSRLEGTTTAVPSYSKPISLKDRPDGPLPLVRREVPSAPLPPLTLDSLMGQSTSLDAKLNEAETSVRQKGTIQVLAPTPKSATAAVDVDSAVDRSVLPAASAASPAIPTIGGLRDWNEVRRRMADLGVSRYELDGRPGGKSRFRCVIPLAGRRAVSQEFEGEGDDDLQAADAALRRLALWKATEKISR